MKKILAPRLKNGDTIGIIAPSSPIRDQHLAQLKKGKKVLKEMGFKLKFAKNSITPQKNYTSTIQQKVSDLHEMILDKSVSVIMCAQGGDSANSILPYINYKLLKSNPNIIIGISDNSLLLNVIHNKTGLITFHGSDLIWGYGKNATIYDQQEFIDRLINKRIGQLNTRLPYKSVRTGNSIRGKLMGGNLRCFLKLAGTPFFPELKDSILFFEACSITPSAAYSMFNQLKQLNVFKKIKGIIIGYIYGLQADTSNLIKMEDILLEVSKEYSFPIFKINDFGHVCENTILPVGALIELDTLNQKIIILEDCVK